MPRIWPYRSADVNLDPCGGQGGLSGEIVERAAHLARAFRERGLPVILVNVSGFGHVTQMTNAQSLLFCEFLLFF